MDLERLFRQLVLNLAATDPTGTHRPLTLAELRHTVVPYRANRRALQIESSEDYELALLRLAAGEAGLARTEPPEVQAKFAAEVGNGNPDLSLLDQHGNAPIHLDPGAVAKILDPQPHLRFAPSQSTIPMNPKTPRKRSRSKPDAPAEVPGRCPRCSSPLPEGRVVNFCPQCGQNLTRLECPGCRAEVEVSWKHCVSCGTPVSSSSNGLHR